MNEPFQHYLTLCSNRINRALEHHLGSFESPYSDNTSTALLDGLRQAMHYSLLNGGKRVRPLLVYAAAEAAGNNGHADDLDAIACAIEMIHSYSLVHDDLPAMDDDALRRGQPTCHIAHGEAFAILAGDGLQSRAFELLSTLPHTDADTRIQLIRILATASGPVGMVGGQAIDLAAVDRTIDLPHLEALHQLKTGALIRAAVELGACFAGASSDQQAALDRYASAIGLCFQVQDDILDIEGDTATLGKQQGADIARNKPTYPALLGMEGAKQKAQDLHQQAIAALAPFADKAAHLRELATYIVSRKH